MNAFTVRQLVTVDADVDVEIDLSDIIDNLDKFDHDELRELRTEINERLAHRTSTRTLEAGIESWTIRGCAHDFRQAFYARDASRMEDVLRGIEILADEQDEP